MLVELGLVEQRCQAVLEVLNDGASVTDVARRFGVARQTVHVWLRNYACGGLGALVDRSSRPATCPHQMAPQVEARIVAMRAAHPGWGSGRRQPQKCRTVSRAELWLWALTDRRPLSRSPNAATYAPTHLRTYAPTGA